MSKSNLGDLSEQELTDLQLSVALRLRALEQMGVKRKEEITRLETLLGKINGTIVVLA